MKKVILFLALGVSSLAFANGAVHISDFGCGMLDGQGSFVVTTDSRVTVTPPQAGVTVLKCSSRNLANNSGRAVQWNQGNTGYLCNTQMGSTSDWSETVSASGQAVLTCKLHN